MIIHSFGKSLDAFSAINELFNFVKYSDNDNENDYLLSLNAPQLIFLFRD